MELYIVKWRYPLEDEEKANQLFNISANMH